MKIGEKNQKIFNLSLPDFRNLYKYFIFHFKFFIEKSWFIFSNCLIFYFSLMKNFIFIYKTITEKLPINLICRELELWKLWKSEKKPKNLKFIISRIQEFKQIFFYNTPMISARFHACGAGLQSRFSKGVSTN